MRTLITKASVHPVLIQRALTPSEVVARAVGKALTEMTKVLSADRGEGVVPWSGVDAVRVTIEVDTE